MTGHNNEFRTKEKCKLFAVQTPAARERSYRRKRDGETEMHIRLRLSFLSVIIGKSGSNQPDTNTFSLCFQRLRTIIIIIMTCDFVTLGTWHTDTHFFRWFPSIYISRRRAADTDIVVDVDCCIEFQLCR